MEDPESLLDRLVQHEVEFVVVGGFAVVAHGASLPTENIEVCMRFTPENLMRLQSALLDLSPIHRMPPGKQPLELTPELCRGLKNLYLDTDYGQLDCLSEVAGIGGYDEVAAESIRVQLTSGHCRIMCLEALIRSKRALGRPRDLEAARQLEAIRERSGTDPNHQG